MSVRATHSVPPDKLRGRPIIWKFFSVQGIRTKGMTEVTYLTVPVICTHRHNRDRPARETRWLTWAVSPGSHSDRSCGRLHQRLHFLGLFPLLTCPLRFWHFLWPWSNMVNNFLLHPSLSVTSKMKQGVPTFLMDTSFFDPLQLSPKVTESQPDSIKILEGKYCFFPSWPCCKYIYKEVTNTVLLLNVLYFQE